MPWYVYIALKQLFPSGKWFSLFSFVSILGVAIGVWMLVVVLSVMNGFAIETRDKLTDIYGHVRIESQEIIYDGDALVALTQENPDVSRASPYASGIVMLKRGNISEFPNVFGIDLNEDDSVIPIENYLLDATLEDLDNYSIFISIGLAEQLGLGIGDFVDVYPPIIIDRLKEGEVIVPSELEITGLFKTGYGAIDSSSVVVSMTLMQDFYAMEGGVHGIQIRLKDINQADAVAAVLNQQLEQPYHAFSWLDMNNDLISVIKVQKILMFFIIIVISVVAAFSITISLFTTVIRKTREIGLYGAFGGTPFQAAAIFCLQGFIIGIVGVCVGFVVAVVFLYFRNDMVEVATTLTGSKSALVQFYQFNVLPLHYSMTDFFLITVSAVSISTLAGLVPAWRASRLKPAEALRNG